MRLIAASLAFVFVLGGAASAQLPAEKGVAGKGRIPADAPKGQKADGEPEKTPGTKLTPKGGGPQRAFPPIASVRYMIGVSGYSAHNGIVVVSSAWAKDLDQRGKVRSPVSEFDVDLRGDGKKTKVKLEPGDRITAIAGYQVRTMHELSVAVNSARDPHRLDVTFTDRRSGKEHTGVINAMRVR